MTKAMMINKADRYDVRGKRILNGKYKYYLISLDLMEYYIVTLILLYLKI